MFQNKIEKLVNLAKVFKNKKLIFKKSTIKNFFFINNFILFYLYDIMSISQQNLIQKKLLDNNLKFYKLKKNILKNFIYENNLNFFNNLLENNVGIISDFKKENLTFNYTLFIKELVFKELHFVGIWLNKQFLRPWELKKYSTISQINNQKFIIQVIKYSLIFNINSCIYLRDIFEKH